MYIMHVLNVSIWVKEFILSFLPFIQFIIDNVHIYIYQPLRSGRIWHKVNF